MTEDKARKKAIRARMAATGEPYSVARHRLADPAATAGRDVDTDDERLARVTHELAQAADPRRRGWYLPNCFQEKQIHIPGLVQTSVFRSHYTDTAAVLRAAYAAILTDGGAGLVPAADAVHAAAAKVMAAACEAAASGASMRQVVFAARTASGPMHAVMAPLDRAARLLLAQPHPVWQAALTPHMPPHERGYLGVDGARERLDAALISAAGGPTVGDVVRMADAELAVVTGARWSAGPPADWPPLAYEISPAAGGPMRGLAVPAEALTVIPDHDADGGREGAQAQAAYTASVALAALHAENQAREDAERGARKSAEDAKPKSVRDWRTRAHVRVVTETTTGAPDDPWPAQGRRWKVGEQPVLVQWGGAGRPIDRDSWWTGYDIDGAHILPADCIEVIEVIEDSPAAVHAEDLGEWAVDDDMIRNGLWNLEGPHSHPDAALAGEENWDYDEVETAWCNHVAAQLAEHGITWDPATARDDDGGLVTLPAAMPAERASIGWEEVLATFDHWIAVTVVDPTREGARQCPPDGIRPDDASGARWITWSTP
jgi:hypothetical protein